MEKQKRKQGFFSRLDKDLKESQRIDHQRAVEMVKLSHPVRSVANAMVAISFVGLLALVIWMFLSPAEIDATCNTGFIGVDYKSTFTNEPYNIDGDTKKLVHYSNSWLPQELNIQNIDGMNCHFKMKVPFGGLLFLLGASS